MENEIINQPQKFNWHSVPLAVLVAGVMISGSILYTGSSGRTAQLAGGPSAAATSQPAPTAIKDFAALATAKSPMLGDPKAKVTIVEFSDFQCPFCRSFFEDTYGQLKKQYIDTGKVRLVFRDFPLSFHPAAKPAALAGQCAQDQGKFWQFHDKAFQEQAKQGQGTVTFGVGELKKWATELGLNVGQFNKCLDSSQHEADVQADMDAGTAAGVSGTPSFFINGQLVVGAQPLSAFQAIIDKALAN